MREGEMMDAMRSRVVSAFRQAGLACSLDNPFELLAERRIVGIPRRVLRQRLDGEAWSNFKKLRNRRRRLGLLPAPGIRRGQIGPGTPERLSGRGGLQAPFDRLRVTRQVCVRVAQDVVPDEQVGIARAESDRLFHRWT